MKKIKRLVFILIALTILFSGIGHGVSLLGDEGIRIAGSNRYQTAVEASKIAYKGGADTVVLATGEGYADALTGTVLAAKEDGPLLLTKSDSLQAYVLDEILRLRAKKVIVLGGESAINSKLVKQIRDKGLEVDRISGENRYDTARAIAKAIEESTSTGEFENKKDKKAFIVSGINFKDALAIGPVAAREGIPILLTKPGDLPPSTKTALIELSTKEALLVGGPAAVGKEVLDKLTSLGISSDRVYGNNAIETAIAVAERYFPKAKAIFLASNQEFPDGLVAGYLAGKSQGPVLLVKPNKLDENLSNYIRDSRVPSYVLGGNAAVSDEVVKGIEKILEKMDRVVGINLVSGPTRQTYTTGDKLDLRGLVVKLEMKDGKEKIVGFSDFETQRITTSPAHGTVLAITNTKVTISLGDLNLDQRISVNKGYITAIGPISGTVKVGHELRAGHLIPSGGTASYQWMIATSPDGTYTDISGAKNKTYTPIAEDAGKFIKVKASGKGEYMGETLSMATSVVLDDAPVRISKVNINKLERPLAGQRPNVSYEIVVEPMGAQFELVYGAWKKNDEAMEDDETFIKGEEYEFTILIKGKGGSYIISNPDLANINGETAESFLYDKDRGIVSINYKFIAELPVVKEVHINDFVPPIEGTKPVYTCKVPDYANYEIGQVDWYVKKGVWVQMGPDEVFEGGGQYSFVLKLFGINEFIFKEEISKVYLNEYLLAQEELSIGADSNSLRVCKVFQFE